ncbi:MAG: hypothetical protein LRZ84_05450 [Desertifilum sp.]|nr:hypothetical protein [Desertifilum sp.]
MASRTQRPTEKTSTYLLRLTPEEKDRWQKMANFYALSLAEFIRQRVNGRPLSAPKVPSINATTSIKMGKFDKSLRSLGRVLNKTRLVLERQNFMATSKSQQLAVILLDLYDLVAEVREELRQVRLQLLAVEDNAEGSSSCNQDLSEFEREDWR